MKIFILVQFLMLLLCIGSYAKNECSRLFTASSNRNVSEMQIETTIRELHGLRIEMHGTDTQVASIAKSLFNIKYRELSKYFSEAEIESRLSVVSNRQDKNLKQIEIEREKSENEKQERAKTYQLISYVRSKGLVNLSDSIVEGGKRFTALHYMVHESREDLIDLLIEIKNQDYPFSKDVFKDFNINAFGHFRSGSNNIDSNPALIHAALLKKRSIVKKLVKLGADINFLPSLGFISPLERIARDGNPSMIRLLVKLGADPNILGYDKFKHHTFSNSMTPLMRASYVGKIDNVKALIDLKADLNKQNENGLTAIFWAHRNEIVQLLYDSGADPNITNKENKTALEVAYDESGNSGWRSRTITLIQITNDVNLPRPGGTTALTQYAKEGQVEIVKALLEKGVDPRAKDSNGNTAYELAKENNKIQVLELLKTYGVTE